MLRVIYISLSIFISIYQSGSVFAQSNSANSSYESEQILTVKLLVEKSEVLLEEMFPGEEISKTSGVWFYEGVDLLDVKGSENDLSKFVVLFSGPSYLPHDSLISVSFYGTGDINIELTSKDNLTPKDIDTAYFSKINNLNIRFDGALTLENKERLILELRRITPDGTVTPRLRLSGVFIEFSEAFSDSYMNVLKFIEERSSAIPSDSYYHPGIPFNGDFWVADKMKYLGDGTDDASELINIDELRTYTKQFEFGFSTKNCSNLLK